AHTAKRRMRRSALTAIHASSTLLLPLALMASSFWHQSPELAAAKYIPLAVHTKQASLYVPYCRRVQGCWPRARKMACLPKTRSTSCLPTGRMLRSWSANHRTGCVSSRNSLVVYLLFDIVPTCDNENHAGDRRFATGALRNARQGRDD